MLTQHQIKLLNSFTESSINSANEKEELIPGSGQSFTYKPEKPMQLPPDVMRIAKAFEDKDFLSDIEAEIKKTEPDVKKYSLNKVFGKDEKGKSKLLYIDPSDRKAIKLSKCRLYVVGGAVRDFLLGIFHPDKLHKTPRNYNLATDARPKAVQLILSNARPDPIEYEVTRPGVVTAIIDGVKYDIETFHEKNGSSVVFTNAGRDAKRRDFRANSLRYDISKEIIEDDVGGFADISEKIPRLKPNSEESIKKDAFLVMRGLRLHGRIGEGGIDQMDQSFVKSSKNTLIGQNEEEKAKCHDEFIEALNTVDDQNDYIKNLNSFGPTNNRLLQQLFPGLIVSDNIDVKQNVTPTVAIALVLKHNQDSKIGRVKSSMKIAGFRPDEITDVVFLLSLPKYFHPDQKESFLRDLDRETRRLIPTHVLQFAKAAKLSNANLIERFLEKNRTITMPE